MKKLRWAMDGDFWELDASTPRTLEGLARPVPGDPIPLGLSRGSRLSRAKQLHFMQRFMTAPFVPSYAAASDGLALHRALTIPFSENWFVSLLGQFNLHKFWSSLMNESGETPPSSASSWRQHMERIGRHLRNKSLYALGFSSELLLTPDDTLLLSLDSHSYSHGNKKTPRKKAVLEHKFPNHNLTVEAVSPGLFVDKSGNYWDVPFSMAIDLASLASDAGASYHLCMHHNTGSPTQFEGDQNTHEPPSTLLPGLSLKTAFSFKQNFDIWRSNAQKLKMVQPYDMFLSTPHVSASGIIGAALTASVGDCSVRAQDGSQDSNGFSFQASGVKSAFLADLFASVSFAAQHGNFQRLYLDLTRFHARFDFPSGSRFLSGATRVTQDLLNSQRPSLDAIQAICPNATLSLQQQIAGPFSFRVDSGVAVDLKNQEWPIRVDEPVFAIEYALHVLGSAKAVGWYSPKHQEFMVELRFFET
ncbi:hypothetical protein FH972_015736 [Carpinus fangiana]|uniref:Protein TRIGALACTOSYLDIACYLGLYCEROL 4, chloroplastic n=1 Tax=Carpinus fangiana TaxID=176857 RepID=A0A5N6RDQ0_9ROSI|nr:hypothetical protein FH972_015736 [Carpinus fangiana]